MPVQMILHFSAQVSEIIVPIVWTRVMGVINAHGRGCQSWNGVSRGVHVCACVSATIRVGMRCPEQCVHVGREQGVKIGEDVSNSDTSIRGKYPSPP